MLDVVLTLLSPARCLADIPQNAVQGTPARNHGDRHRRIRRVGDRTNRNGEELVLSSASRGR